MKYLLVTLFFISILSSCSVHTDYLYRIVVNNKIGYIDQTGHIAIEPEYDYYVYPQFDWTRYNAYEGYHNKSSNSQSKKF